jgi:hypothetical protein
MALVAIPGAGREARSDMPGAHGLFLREKTKLIREPLSTSSVSVAAAVTQCCIHRIVLALPWRSVVVDGRAG